MIWWVEHAARLKEERIAISELEESSAWLRNVVWRPVPGPNFEVDFQILHGEQVFDLTLRYPDYFPNTPALVFPQGDERLSSHQWGAGGELCLEYRADNWEPQVTGTMMIESAYRLLSGEHPDDGRGQVPSAHRQSAGQELRGENLRFMLPVSLYQKLHEVAPVQVLSTIFTEKVIDKTCVASINSIRSEDSAYIWRESGMIKGWQQQAIVFRATTFEPVVGSLDLEMVAALLLASGFAEASDKVKNDQNLNGILLADNQSARFGYIFEKEGKRKILWYETIVVPEQEARLPEIYQGLSEKSVAIIGCGSVGSKIASILARTGIGKFVLVDDDIFLPGNMVRNDLDGRYVGQHKTIAVKDRILDIEPTCVVETRQVAFGGQEAAGTTASVFEQLSSCDLIIEATANPNTFNLCAAAAQIKRKPLVWTEVYGGGVGGLVVRCRPDKDPPPVVARRQIILWCDEHGMAWETNAGRYDTTEEGQAPLIADDGDVSVIAAHAARMAIDILARPEEDTIFPRSAYMIGLAKGLKIFNQPFQTYPITLIPEAWRQAASINEEQIKEALDFLVDILPKPKEKDEDSASA